MSLSLWGCNPAPPPTSDLTPTPAASKRAATPGAKTPPPTEAPAQTVIFDNDTWYLADSRTRAMGAPMKEFLLDGQTFEDYSRLLAFHLSSGKDLSVYEKSFETQIEKSHPGAEQKVLERSPKTLTRSISWKETDEKEGAVLEYDFWSWRLTPKGIASLQLIVRNRGDLKDPAAFKKFVESHQPQWLKESEKLSKEFLPIIE